MSQCEKGIDCLQCNARAMCSSYANFKYEQGYAQAIHDYEIMKENADGCRGCAFENVNEWELPCTKCKRNCKDYWRVRKEQI